MTMTETIRDNEHDEDVMVQLMFGMLCPPEDEARPRSRRSEAPIVDDKRGKGRRGGSVADDKTTTDGATTTTTTTTTEHGIHR
jgi:hypothetical protein